MLVGVMNKVLPLTTVFLEEGDVVEGTGCDLEVPSEVTFSCGLWKNLARSEKSASMRCSCDHPDSAW